jgi:two-component system chemotaxis sensor kinase CheA
METTADSDELPVLQELVPDNFYLSWTIELLTTCDIDDVEEVFEWVEGECELSITPMLEDSTVAVDSPTLYQLNDSQVKKPTTSGQRLVMPSGPLPSLDNLQLDITPEPVQAMAVAAQVTAPVKAEASSIRVGIDKVDSLINLVGELVITQSMLGQMGSSGEIITDENIEKLRERLVQLEQNTRELQDSVMRIRMLPISFTFNRFPRMVRDISIQLGKKVQLELRGENTELDKTVMEKISDPMVHLIRNALDHGIEMPAQRIAAGKPEVGTIVFALASFSDASDSCFCSSTSILSF